MKIVYISLVLIVLISSFAYYIYLCKSHKKYGKYLSLSESTFPLIKPINLDLQKNNLLLYTGCNNIFGEYVINNGELIVEKLMQSKMGCDEAYLNLEFRLDQFLNGKPTITFEKNKITLTGRDGSSLIFKKRFIEMRDV